MMRKALFCVAAAGLLMTAASCGNGTSQKEQVDSLQTAIEQRNADYEELSNYLTVIAAGLDSIAAQEGHLFATNSTPGESPVLSREQISKNLEAYKQTLSKQRQKIAELEKKLRSSNANAAQMRTIINSLSGQLAAKDAELDAMRKELSNRNVSIDYLMASMKSLQMQNASQQQTIASQQADLKAKESQLNEAFVKMGPRKELKNLGLLSGGNLLKKSKLDYDKMDKKLFQRIDISKTTRIEIPYKEAKILTPVPSGTYTMQPRDGYNYLVITDAERFWSVSNYLIIETDD
ncbi:MAG: hypothetical protein IJ637_00635 [Prevotella sp.]|nr:hypothetical protein [Prevotella sp.]